MALSLKICQYAQLLAEKRKKAKSENSVQHLFCGEPFVEAACSRSGKSATAKSGYMSVLF